MSEKIQIEIQEPYLSVLRKWASVSRTLRTAESICSDMTIVAHEKKDQALFDRSSMCEEELQTLTPALDYLFMTVRDQLWKS